MEKTSPLLEKYKEADRQEKQAKAIKAKLRSAVLEELHSNDYEDINYQVRNSVRVDEDLLLEWLRKSQPPELVQGILKSVIDLEKLELLIITKKLDIQDLPPECYSVTQSEAITVKK